MTVNSVLSLDSVVPFNGVISNFGCHYSTDTYAFTCPVHGVYTLSMAINQYNKDYERAILYRNDEELIRGAAADAGSRDSTSATVITECNAGDQVFVIAGQYGGRFDGNLSPCHLTGFLLHQL